MHEALRHRLLWLLSGGYLLVLMHLYLPNRGGSGLYLPINLVGAMMLCLLVLACLWPARGTFLYGSRLQGLLTAGIGVLMLPLLWTSPPYLGAVLPRTAGLALSIVTGLALLQWRLDRQARRRLMLLLLAAGLMEAFLGLAQYAGYWPGGAPHASGAVPRPYGVFQQWNVMASFMAVTLALSLVLATRREAHGNLLSRGIMASSQVLAPLLLVVIASRAGLLAAVLLTPLQWLALRRHDRTAARWAGWRVVLGAAVGLALNLLLGVTRSVTDEAPLSYRLTYWRETLAMIADKPVLGWGYGHFQGDFLRFFHARHADGMENVALTHPHNELLLWGMEGGAVALTGCALVFWALWRLAARHRRGGFARLGGRPWVAALPLGLHAMVEYPFYLSAAHGVVLLLLLRLSDRRRRLWAGNATLPRLARAGLRTVSLTVAVAGVLYYANGLRSAAVVTSVERGGLRDLPALATLPRPTPWQDRLDYDLALGRLLGYQADPAPWRLAQYRQWALQALQVQPDAVIYLNLAAIARLQGDATRTTDLMNEARRLFPHDGRLPPARALTGERQ